MPEQETQLRNNPTERTIYPGIPTQVIVEKVIPYIPLSLIDQYHIVIQASNEVPSVNKFFVKSYRERSGTTTIELSTITEKDDKNQSALSGWEDETPVNTEAERPFQYTFEGTSNTFWIIKRRLPNFMNPEKPYPIKQMKIRFRNSPRAIMYEDGLVTLIEPDTTITDISDSGKELVDELFSYLKSVFEQESVDLKVEQIEPKKLQSLLLSLRGIESAGLAALGFINNPGLFPKIAGSIMAAYSALCLIYENGVDNDINELQKKISAQAKLLK